jgi:Ca2+/Na+ antiporter
LTPLMNISFTKTLRMWKSAKAAFQLGIGNIHKFIVPCIMSLLTLLVTYYILAFVLNKLKIEASIGLVVLIIYVLLYLAWRG